MGFEWTDYTLSELVEVSSSKRIKRAEYIDKGIPFFRSKEIIERSKGNNISTEIFISSERFKEIKARHGAPYKGDILLTSVGTLGVAYQVKDNEVFYFKDGNLTWFRHFKDTLNKNYLYWWLTSPLTQRKLYEVSIGSTQRALTISALQKLKINLPDLSVQREIVNHLEKIHNKIQLNNQINQTLEAMAQAIFKSWFVDFDPVLAKRGVLDSGGSIEDAERAAMRIISSKTDKQLEEMAISQPNDFAELQQTASLFPSQLVDSELGEIPEGWEVGMLEEVIEFNPKRSLLKGSVVPYLDMKNVPTKGHSADEVVLREFKSGTKFKNGDTLFARITPCLENGKTAYVDFLESEEQIGWGSTEFIVMRSKSKYPLSLSYFIARNDHFREAAIMSMTGSSGRQRANANALANHTWLLYPLELIERFGEVADRFLKVAKENNAQNQNLAELRDTLLPKLFSGELDVSQLVELKDD
ncbi:restriction endonuclease subunit S [Psychrobacter sp. HY3-MNA-CIBAN-0198]|uniref:restriction endonuclease subunit S n=1 Tax=Psychrobacter sp. HY3-MNA-CIBAN-0198 TaxID=3140441 RepID=UPI00331F3FDD